MDRVEKIIIIVVLGMLALNMIVIFNMFGLIHYNNINLQRIADQHDVGLSDIEYNGLYYPSTGNIMLVTDGRTRQDVCLTFLHEFGHAIDYSSVVGKTIAEREEFAVGYARDNAWRCDGV